MCSRMDCVDGSSEANEVRTVGPGEVAYPLERRERAAAAAFDSQYASLQMENIYIGPRTLMLW